MTTESNKGKQAIERELVLRALEEKTQLQRDDLIEFIKAYFKGETPKGITEFTVDPYLYVIAEHLQQVFEGKINRLIINIPPGHSKTEMVSKCFPAWALGKNPHYQIITTGYSASLTVGFSQQTKDIYNSPTYRKIFPRHTDVSIKQNTKEHWINEDGGSYYATGTSGAITGLRTNCLVGETLIQTEEGEVSIEKLAINDKKIKVKSYNHTLNKIEYKEILAYQVSNNNKIYEITTSTGIKVKGTGEHKFFVLGQGYKKAKDLREGDKINYSHEVMGGLLKNNSMKRFNMSNMLFSEEKIKYIHSLLIMLKGNYKTFMGSKKANKKRSKGIILFQKMSRYLKRGTKQKNMSQLSTDNGIKNKEILLRNMSSGIQEKEQEVTANKLQRVWNKGRSNFSFNKILLNELQKLKSFKINVIKKQSKLQTLTLKERLSIFFLQAKEKYSTKRLKQMCSLLMSKSIMYSSQRSQSIKQSSSQSNNSLQSLSHDSSQVKTDTISNIKILDGDTKVYDIEVQDNNNFFANSILVHNCFIIDDPIKPEEAVKSDVKRISINEWFDNTVISRLFNPKKDAIIIIMQRTHEDDLCGHIMNKMEEQTGEDFTVLSLPAICEEDEKFETRYGEVTREPGDPLAPSRFSLGDLDLIRKSYGPVNFDCQYQQNPIAKGSQEFIEEWFKSYETLPDGYSRTFTSVDPAFSKKKTADNSVITTVKLFGDEIYILKQTAGKYDPAELEDIMIEHIKEFKPEAIGVEAIAAQVTISFSLKRRLLKEQIHTTQIVEIRQKEDKNAKIRALIPLYRNGLIHHLPDMEDLENELMKFPRGRHDDRVDGLQMILYMIELTPGLSKKFKLPTIKYNKFGIPVIVK